MNVKSLPPFILFLFWQLATVGQQTLGLFLNDSLSVNGYTLFSNSEITYLIDNCGRVVNQWESDFKTNTAVYLLENGNLLRTCRIANEFSAGGSAGRVEMFNWDGELVWAYNYSGPSYHLHHDIEPMPNGNILLLAWEAHTQIEAIEAGRAPVSIGANGIWAEHIVEVQPKGTDSIDIVWEWHLWDHLVQEYDSTKPHFAIVANHPELIDINYGNLSGGHPDWIHANAVAYNPDLDQIAISSRHFNEIWIIDHSTTSAEAAGHSGGLSGKGGDLLYRRGNPAAYHRGTAGHQTLWGQHNITWIRQPDHPHFGRLLVFNNGFGRPDSNFSSIDIWTPPMLNGQYFIGPNQPFGPEEPDWTFTQPGFYSSGISGVHALPRGHLFICEGRLGRFFEITPEGQTVWEYINPVSSFIGPLTQGQPPFQNNTFRATRYPVGFPAFEGKDLSPGAPVELEPLPTNCVIFSPSSITSPPKELSGISLLTNPVGEVLRLFNESVRPLKVEVFNLYGYRVATRTSNATHIEVPLPQCPAGLYLLRACDERRQLSLTLKFVKH
ncbi:MAG TPA: hypothetical protein ENJ20_04765 [Bacteroidetes bacterium]|nr:hypothetical protein [Bacteroidota bacterium]